MYFTVDVQTNHNSERKFDDAISRIRKTMKHYNLTTFWVHMQVAHV